MKRERSDISLLLIILVLFSASIGLLHGFKISLLSASSDQAERISLSEQDAFDMVSSFLSSDDMVGMAKTLQQFDPKTQSGFLQKILKGDGIVFTDTQKVRLLGSLAAFQDDVIKKAELFSRLSKQFPQMPLFVLLIAEQPKLIASIKKWAKKENKKEIYNEWKKLSVIEAIKMNNVALLTDLYTNGVRMAPTEASVFLDRVVMQKKDVGFVPLLIGKFGANVHYSGDGKRTALMKAVETNNPDMVRVLIDEGANPHLILDPIVGSAVQLAAEKKLKDIEKIISGQ